MTFAAETIRTDLKGHHIGLATGVGVLAFQAVPDFRSLSTIIIGCAVASVSLASISVTKCRLAQATETPPSS